MLIRGREEEIREVEDERMRKVLRGKGAEESEDGVKDGGGKR